MSGSKEKVLNLTDESTASTAVLLKIKDKLI